MREIQFHQVRLRRFTHMDPVTHRDLIQKTRFQRLNICFNDVMCNEGNRPNGPAAEPGRWLWRPNKQRGNYGLLLTQALLPVWFFTTLPGNSFPQQERVWWIWFVLVFLGTVLFITGFGMNEKTNTRKVMFSTMWPLLTLYVVTAIAAIASAFTPSLVSVFVLFMAQFIAAWVCGKAAEQLNKATQLALSTSSTSK